jgi:hypothetical protein
MSQAKDVGEETGSAEAFTATAQTYRSEGWSIENQDLPPQIRVDEQTYKEVARRIGRGYQVYDCMAPSGPATMSTWKFREPQADLYDHYGKQRGIHFIGPNWADADGSRVLGTLAGQAESPDDPSKDVAWLLVKNAQNFGFSGVFSDTTFIQRVLTDGGLAPPSCDANGGATLSMRYSALYIFWARR